MRPITRPRPALLVALLVCTAGCATHRASGVPAAPPSLIAIDPDPVQADYRLGPEDVIEISVWRNDALSRTVPVRPDGAISLPLINDVEASGLTPMELRAVIAQRLTAFMTNPEVSVIVREVHSAKVSVLGEVVHPGRYELRGPTTVLEILAHAGGLSPFASRSQILVLRPHGSGAERIKIDEEQALADKSQQNLVLQSGDLVFVP